jgi:hypothetical protein
LISVGATIKDKELQQEILKILGNRSDDQRLELDDWLDAHFTDNTIEGYGYFYRHRELLATRESLAEWPKYSSTGDGDREASYNLGVFCKICEQQGQARPLSGSEEEAAKLLDFLKLFHFSFAEEPLIHAFVYHQDELRKIIGSFHLPLIGKYICSVNNEETHITLSLKVDVAVLEAEIDPLRAAHGSTDFCQHLSQLGVEYENPDYWRLSCDSCLEELDRVDIPQHFQIQVSVDRSKLSVQTELKLEE